MNPPVSVDVGREAMNAPRTIGSSLDQLLTDVSSWEVIVTMVTTEIMQQVS